MKEQGKSGFDLLERMNRIICADCRLSKAANSGAYCKKKRIMVRLAQDSCEMFENGLIQYRRRAL